MKPSSCFGYCALKSLQSLWFCTLAQQKSLHLMPRCPSYALLWRNESRMLYWRAISKEIFTDIKFRWQASRADPIALKALYLAKHSASLLLPLPLSLHSSPCTRCWKTPVSASNQIEDIVISNYFRPLIGYLNYKYHIKQQIPGQALFIEIFLFPF